MKVLIVKLGAIGDTVMALSLIAPLKEKGAHITWITGQIPAPLLKEIKELDTLITVDELKLLKGNVFQQFWQLAKLWKKIFFKSFDLVITAHVDIRYRLLSLFVRASKRSYFRPKPGRYHAEEYVQLAVPSVDTITFPKFSGSKEVKREIIVAPGGAKNILADDALRRWPISHYVQLVDLLIQEGFAVTLTGSASDEWVLPHFQGRLYENLIGKKNLVELIHVLSNCDLLITHDSGPLHLAKLARCQAVALFGPTNPHEKVSPDEKIKVLWGGESLSCRPCYDGKNYAACKNNRCLANMTPHYILSEVKKLYENSSHL